MTTPQIRFTAVVRDPAGDYWALDRSRRFGVVVIATLDPVTGEAGPLVPVTGAPTLHVEELRFFAGTLYAASRDGTLVTIDPSTGATTVVPVPIGRVHAMEGFEPRPAPP